MFEEAQHAELPEDALAGDQILEDIRHFFESNFPSIPRVRHRPGELKTHITFLCFTDGLPKKSANTRAPT